MAQDHSRIFKNSIMLYLRMAFTVIIGLYTSRVLLRTLGVEDYGIYSVVGGLAVLFSFFSNALNQSTQRFLTVAIGKEDSVGIRRVFSAAIHCHVFISLIIVLLSETIGLWFLNTQLVIREERMYAANMIFQVGMLSLILNVLNVPYIASVIAYERMTYFAFTSIMDALLKLVIVLFLNFASTDKLIFYSLLLFAVSLLKFIIDRWYCQSRFCSCRYVAKWEGTLQREMLHFTGWNLFKTASVVGVNQSNNFIVNILGGGALASAAMGLANQMNGHVYSFMSNVQTAFNPQITKTCHNRELTDSFALVRNASCFSALMLMLVAIPLIINMEFVLRLWLGEVPEGTAALCVMCLFSCFVDALFGPINTAILAHGKIKRYQIVTSLLWWIAIPLAVIMMQKGLSFEFVIVAKICSQLLVMGYGLSLMKRFFDFPVFSIMKQTLVPMILLFSVVWGVAWFVVARFDIQEGWARLSVSFVVSTAMLLIFYWFFLRSRLFPDRL